MTAKKLFDETYKLFKTYNIDNIKEEIKQMEEPGIKDVYDRENTAYYQWLPGLVNYLKPKQIVELGGAMGVACIMMLSVLPENSYLFSITLPENGLEFSYIKKKYLNFYPIIGNDLNLSIWPKNVDLYKTDLWFIDSEHNYVHFMSEWNLYRQFFKKGTVILIDDIRYSYGMFKAWTEIEGDKYDASLLHHSGFGILIYDN